jgi:hypothetical protein
LPMAGAICARQIGPRCPRLCGSHWLMSSKVMAYTYLTPSWVILWEIAMGNPAPALLVLVGVGLTMVALWMLLKQEG